MTSRIEDDQIQQSLMQHAREGNVEAIKVLLDAGAEVNHRSRYGSTALHLAAREGYQDELAQTGQRAATVRLLLAAGADVHSIDQNGNTPLIAAALADEAPWEDNHVDGRGGTIRALLEAGSDVNAQNTYGWTALMVAAGSGQTEDVRTLLAAGADTELRNDEGRTALMRAVDWGRGRTETVQTLLEANANPQAIDWEPVVYIPGQEESAPHRQALADLIEDHTARMFVEGRADIHKPDANGDTPLMQLIQHGGRPDNVRALLAAGADPNAQNGNGDTPLIQTAAYWPNNPNNTETMQALIHVGAIVDHQNKAGETALMAAALKFDGHENIKLLLGAGADPTLVNKKGETARDLCRPADTKSLQYIAVGEEREQLRRASGLTDDQEPVQRTRRM